MTKKLQIVRVDNDLVQKANLQIGNNIIGRGAATGVSYIIRIHHVRYSSIYKDVQQMHMISV